VLRIETNDRRPPPERDRHRKANVAQSDDRHAPRSHSVTW
jgi:hypothetical protein